MKEHWSIRFNRWFINVSWRVCCSMWTEH